MTKVKKLDSGITMLFTKDNKKHSVAMGIFVNAGSANETKDWYGTAHFLEHMHFKGTPSRDVKQLAMDIDSMGGHVNAYTSQEITAYHATVLDKNAEKAANFLVDIFANSSFDVEELEREKGVVIEEIRMSEDDYDDVAFEILEGQIFKDTIYESRVLGDEECIKTMTREKLFEFKENQYVKDGIVVSIYGNYDEENLTKIFSEGLKKYKQSKLKPVFKKYTYTPRYITKVKDIQQAHIYLGRPGIKIADADFFAFKAASTVLGKGMGSRLFQNIREQRGLAYSVYSGEHRLSHAGLEYIGAGISMTKIEDALKAIKYELELLKDKGITEEELAHAKEKIETGLVFGYENANTVLNFTAQSYILLGRVKGLEEQLKEVEELSLEKVNEVAKILGDSTLYSIGMVADKEMDLERIFTR